MTATAVHLYAWRRDAVAVPPYGRPIGEKFRLGAWVCVLCHGLETWHTYWCADCPGAVAQIPAPRGCPPAPPLTSANPEQAGGGVIGWVAPPRPPTGRTIANRAIHHIVTDPSRAIIAPAELS